MDPQWLTLTIFLSAQAISGIWWASKITTSLSYIREQITVQAQRDLATRDVRIDHLEGRINELARDFRACQLCQLRENG